MSANTAARPHWFFTVLALPLEATLPYTLALTDPALLRHLKTVMRVRPGDSVILVDPTQEQPFLAIIDEVSHQALAVTLLSKHPCPPRRATTLIAAVSLIKGQHWDWLLQKLTELGIDEIHPIQAARSMVTVDDVPKKLARWQEIVKNAAEQSERSSLPHIMAPQTPEAWLSNNIVPVSDTLCLMADARGGSPLGSFLHAQNSFCPKQVAFAIGPEGGWTADEEALWTHGGFSPVHLGDTILRSETAAIAIASVLSDAYSTQAHCHA